MVASKERATARGDVVPDVFVGAANLIVEDNDVLDEVEEEVYYVDHFIKVVPDCPERSRWYTQHQVDRGIECVYVKWQNCNRMCDITIETSSELSDRGTLSKKIYEHQMSNLRKRNASKQKDMEHKFLGKKSWYRAE